MSYHPAETFYYSKDIHINYELMGHGDKNIIFLHGFSLSLHSWNSIKSKFDLNQYKLYFVDLKGSGFSYKGNEGAYTLTEQVAIIASFIATHNISSFILVGHSYGGVISLILNEKFNKRSKTIEKLILLDTPGFPEATPFSVRFLKLSLLSRLVLGILPARWSALFTIRQTFFYKKSAVQKFLKRYTFFFNLKRHNTALIRLAKGLDYHNHLHLLETYTENVTETLLLWGENDQLIPLKYGHRLNNELRNSTLKIIKNCGHVPHEECPDITYKLIDEFITT